MWLRAFLLLVVLLPVLHLAWNRWYGAHAVRTLCARDGGERIFETAYVQGYLTNDHDYLCRTCIELLVNRQFEYLDADVKEPGRPAGYFRYSLGKRGDDGCEDWSHQPEGDRLLRQFGVKADECIVLTELPHRPVGVVLSQQWKAFSYQGVDLRLNQWTLTDERAGKLLAQMNDYQFTSKLTAVLDMSGHGGNADEKCMKGNTYVNSVTTLPSRVLRDAGHRSVVGAEKQ